MKTLVTSILVLLLLALLVLPATAAGATVHRFTVDCDHASLDAAVDRHTGGVPILVEFSGTCNENVSIERDDVTVRGVGADPIIVGQLLVAGAAKVHIEGFTVRNLPSTDPIFDRDGDGVRVRASQLVSIEDLHVVDSGSRGINVEDASSADIRDVVIERSSGIGLAAVSNATISLEGETIIRDSLFNGMCAFNSGSVFFRPNSFLLTERNTSGMLLESQGSIAMADGARVLTRDNNAHGVFMGTQGSLTLADATIESRGNAAFGVAIQGVTHIAPLPGSFPILNIYENGAGGMAVVRGANVFLTAGGEIADNPGGGVFVDGAVLMLAGTSISDNGPGDMILTFGSQVTLLPGNEIASPIFCDGSVRLRGGECVVPGAASRLRPFDSKAGVSRDLMGVIMNP